MTLRTWSASMFCVCFVGWHMTGVSWERSHTAIRELSRLIPNFQKKIDEGSPEELSEFYAEVSKIVVDIGVFTCWISISFSMVPMAPVVTTWVGFVHASQIGWTRPTLAPRPYWMPTAAWIGESRTTSQDSSYVLQNLIGITLCKSSFIQLNQVTPSLFTVFVLSYAHLTKSLTGFPATTRGVSMRSTNQTWLSWNPGTWKARFSSKYVDFLLLFSLYFILGVFTGL